MPSGATWTAARVDFMVSVWLIQQWKSNGQRQDDVCKRVTMPALPLPGTRLFLHSEGTDWEWFDSYVESIDWYESRPDSYDVVLRMEEFGEDVDIQSQIDGLLAMGWHDAHVRFRR
jgi:hypothetical protein